MKKNEMLYFKCVSDTCSKAIRPLTFFDGSIWCPNCRKNLFLELRKKAESGVRAKENPEGFFSFSQELFARYLCEGGGRAALANAIAYCRKAAYELDPYALLNLGYYYSLGYDETVHVETGRAFAKLCFELAGKCAPAGDADFVNLINDNLASLKAPVKKSNTSDAYYLEGLIKRMDSMEKSAAPRLGVFAVSKASFDDPSANILALLKKLFGRTLLYLIQDTARQGDELRQIEYATDLKGCFKEKDVVWFAYRRKGEPIGKYKGKLSRHLRNRKEILQNLYNIFCAVQETGNRSADFSDQDVLICTFDSAIYRDYGLTKGDDNSPFDRLSKVYKAVQETR